MTSSCIVCLARRLEMPAREGVGAEVVCGVVWCGVVCVFRVRWRGQNFILGIKRDNAVMTSRLTR